MDKELMFKVGDMAAIHDIPAKTLRYYDEIDLFKPAIVNAENNYRYYSIDQFELLNSIKFLRSHGFSISRIKEHLKVKDSKSFIEQMELQKKLYETEQKRIRKALFYLNERIDELQMISSGTDFGRIRIVEKAERSIIFIKREISSIRDIEINLKELEKKAGIESSVMIGRVGLTVNKSNLISGNYSSFGSIFILNTGDSGSGLNSILPAGEYASVLINSGDHSSSAGVYPDLLNYIRKEGYEVSGDAIERVIIDSFITADKNEFTTEIDIPVSKGSLVKADGQYSH